ncbi:MAG: endonuclease IV, partial [Oscillospiraceae bacterium]|nr:endonuclease IV [Oscillospiraceae bacterium]
MVKFGTAGLDANFTLQGFKKTIEAPIYLEKMGLDAFEYQCGRGVRVSDKMASEFGAACKAKNITLSLHAPYYISMSSLDET